MAGKTTVAAMLFFAWFVSSTFVDFVVIPKAFKLTSQAGNLGIFVFNAINKLELVFGIAATTLIYLSKPLKLKKLILFLALFVSLLAIYYNLYLTPIITEISNQLALSPLKAASLSLDPYQLKLDHGFYHKQYVMLDSVKLLVLLTLSILIPWVGVEFREAQKAIKESK